MVRAYASLVLGSLVAVSVAACAEASSDTAVGGTPRFDPTPPPPPTNAPTPNADSGAGVTFTDLYRDFFGPTGAASCAGGSAGCHGAKGDPGGGVFVCADNKAECRTSIAGLASGASFQESFLFSILRKDATLAPSPPLGTNRMPKNPKTYAFDKAGMDRIGAWVAAGSKDD